MLAAMPEKQVEPVLDEGLFILSRPQLFDKLEKEIPKGIALEDIPKDGYGWVQIVGLANPFVKALKDADMITYK